MGQSAGVHYWEESAQGTNGLWALKAPYSVDATAYFLKPFPTADPKPRNERRVEEAAVNENGVGLRDKDYPTVKPPNTRRVLLLGDSFTFGYGLTDDDAVSAGAWSES